MSVYNSDVSIKSHFGNNMKNELSWDTVILNAERPVRKGLISIRKLCGEAEPKGLLRWR